MNNFSGNTSVTLTTRGWLLLAQEALTGIEHASETEGIQYSSEEKRSIVFVWHSLPLNPMLR
jgi:hypothetical protein